MLHYRCNRESTGYPEYPCLSGTTPASRLLYIPGISRNYLTMVMHHLLPGSLFHLYLERHIHNPPYSSLLTLPAIKVEIHLPKGYVRDNFQAHNQAMSSKKT
jgi:hypothetical protein